MTFRGIDEDEAQEAVDRLLSEVMDDYLAECESSPVRFLSVLNNGREYKIRIENNVIWFPSGRMKGRPKK